MATIDSCIRALFETKVDAVGIASGHPLFALAGGQRQILESEVITSAAAEAMLRPLLSAEAQAQLETSGLTEATHESTHGPVQISARRVNGGLQMMLMRPSPHDGAAGPSPAGNGRPLQHDDKPIDRYFRDMVERGGSDLYLCTHKRPLIRKDGDIVPLAPQVLSEDDVKALVFAITPDKYKQEFSATHDVDFAYEIPGFARFRANLFRDKDGMGGVFRQIPAEILTAEKLNLPKAILDLCMLNKGLVLVTGPTGSGKSTTIAAMIDHINRNRSAHIITIEDPIEFVHQDKRSVVNQREVGTHTGGFKRALRAALREDPDVVLVGEMRDLETVSIAIETAETGHLVLATLHTNTAGSAVDRIVDQYPTDQQQQIRIMLAETLKGVVAQTLCKKKGGGRVAALEILLVPHAVSNLIRESKTHQIPSVLQTQRGIGMCTLNDSLQQLFEKSVITVDEAINKAVDRADMRNRLQRLGAPLPPST